MEITLLGTGCPVASPRRYGPANLIRGGGVSLLVDCGSGVTQRLVEAGASGAEIDAVLLTHLHSDHIVDLFQLVISSWHQGRDRPQRVFGPPGTRAFVEGLMALWRPELRQRIEHEARRSTAALEVEVREIAPEEVLTFGGLALRVVAVDHRPVRHVFGFEVEAGDKRLVISGDTRPCEGLAAAARGADLLVQEVFIHRDMDPKAAGRGPETLARVGRYHTASHEVGKVAHEAGVGALLLTHFVPPACDGAALLAEVGADYGGPIILGEDGLSVDLAAGRVRYRGLTFGLPRT